jgi:hypothetical protein
MSIETFQFFFFMSINSLNGKKIYNKIDKENINVRLIDVYLLPNSAVF